MESCWLKNILKYTQVADESEIDWAINSLRSFWQKCKFLM